MYTVGQVADHLNIADTTVRMWGRDFADYLSDSANPPKGNPRIYTDGDVAILATIAALRARQVEFSDIRQQLNDGVLIEPLEPLETPLESPAGGNLAPQIGQAFDNALTTLERQNSALTEQVNALHERLLDAEKRATAAETELKILKEKQPTESPPAADNRSWWDKLLGR